MPLEQHEASTEAGLEAVTLLGFAAYKTAFKVPVVSAVLSGHKGTGLQNRAPVFRNTTVHKSRGTLSQGPGRGWGQGYVHRTMSLMMGWGTDSPAVS